jgi:serine/threonine protein kinase/Tol biopolymer transport system component
MALMSRLLDETLPLDEAGRRLWLDKLPPEYGDLAQALRSALLPGEVEAAAIDALAALPKLDMGDAAATTAAGLQLGARIGPYELMRLLGAGGMAEVWLARRADGAFRREVALKLPMSTQLRVDLEQRFALERDILASLEHPHIARLYDAGIDVNRRSYLAMEYVQGQPLTEWCDAQRLEISERLVLFLQVLEAVQYAHEKQVIHRDLKPSNILVTDSGQVRLLDFGVAKLLEADTTEQTPLTNVYGRALTPDYASPELLRGAPVDARSDLYSLGILLYELLTGVRPYTLERAGSMGMLEQAIATVEIMNPSSQSDPDALAARATTALKMRRQLRGDLDAILLKALAKHPLQRYASAASLAEDLKRYLEGEPIQARAARYSDRLRKFVRRNRVAVAVGATALAAVLATAAILVFTLLRQNPEHLWRDPLAEARVTRLTDFAGSEQAAAISRDGRFVAFLADRDGQIDAWLTEIGSNRYRNLTNGQIRGLANSSLRTVGFSPDGALVTLWTRSGDGARPEDIQVMGAPTTGGPLQVYLREGPEFDWSLDGRLVYHTTAPGDPLFVRRADESTAHQIYVAPPGIHCHFPTWSPDGEFIYFVRGEPPADWDIWRLRPSGSDPERITFHHSRVTYPVLLDPRTLIYLATDANGSGPMLNMMDLPRRRAHRISVGLERYLSLSASANGMRLVATVANSQSELWRMTLGDGPPQSTAEPVAASPRSAAAPRFGPGYIAYVATSGGRRGIWKLANDAATELWGDAAADRVGAPAISPDGRRIAFTVARRDRTELHVIDSDGNNAGVIATALVLRGDLAWTPDSRSIVTAVVRNGEPRLEKIFLDGSPSQPLASEYSMDPVWSPDGKYFVFSGADVGTTFPLRASGPDGRPYGMPSMVLTRGARRVAFARNSGSLIVLRGEMVHKNLWLVDPQKGTERQLTNLPSNFLIADFDISPDGTEIVVERVLDSSNIALIERPPTRG